MSLKPFDDAFKDLAEHDAEALLNLLGLLPPGATVKRLPREVALQALLTDQPYEINDGAARYIQHLEAQSYWRGDEAQRAAGYSVRLWLKHELPVYTYFLVFSPKGLPAEPPAAITIEAGGITLIVRLRVIGLWQLSAARALALGRASLLPFVPLMQGGLAELEQSAAALCAVADETRRSTLALNFVMVGNMRYPKADLLDLLRRFSTMVNIRELTRETEFYQEILAEGRAAGQAAARAERLAAARKLLRQMAARHFHGCELGPVVEQVQDAAALERLCDELWDYADAAKLQRLLAELAATPVNGQAHVNGNAEGRSR